LVFKGIGFKKLYPFTFTNMTFLVFLVGCFAVKQLISRSERRHVTSGIPEPKHTYKAEATFNLDESISTCPLNTEELRSLAPPQAKQTKVQFHNSAREAANLFWYDNQGNPSFRATIPSNGFFASNTWEGHAFRVWNKDLTVILLDLRVGRKVVGYDGGRRKERYKKNFGIANIRVRTDLPLLDLDGARKVGFVNRLDEELDIYYVNHKGVERRVVSQLAPGAVYYEITYHMHRFRARIHGDLSNKIVKDLQIGDIEIPDCDLPNSKNTNEIRKETERESSKNKRKKHNKVWTLTIMRNSTISGIASM
jgi:hypothetical protein